MSASGVMFNNYFYKPHWILQHAGLCGSCWQVLQASREKVRPVGPKLGAVVPQGVLAAESSQKTPLSYVQDIISPNGELWPMPSRSRELPDKKSLESNKQLVIKCHQYVWC